MRIKERYCRGNVQERKGAWASCKLYPHASSTSTQLNPSSLLVPQQGIVIVHARKVSFWTGNLCGEHGIYGVAKATLVIACGN